MILYKVIKEADKSTPFSKAVGAAQVYFHYHSLSA